MAKLKIDEAFEPWKSTDKNLYRSSKIHWVSVRKCDPSILTTEKGTISIEARTLGEAIDYADKYILDNFEFPKTDSEKLKEAEEEIVQLKAELQARRTVSTRERP